MFHILLQLNILLVGFIGAWVFWRFRLFSRDWTAVPDGSTIPGPKLTYEVRMVRQSSHGAFYQTVYAGDDLFVAKEVFNTTTGPARTIVELHTRGNHTASRKA